MTVNTIPEYTIRRCSALEEFGACVEMQRRVWRFDDLDITPMRTFVITRQSGGFTLGAFDNSGHLLGFAHALAAFDDRLKPYYYSQMLAVDPSLQNSGIGVKLKLAQREHAQQTGVPLMIWTFDPLQSRNAYLNIIKLGGVVRKYYPNYYGNQSTSELHRGLDTDRVFIEWWIGSQQVADALAGKPRDDRPEAIIEVPRSIEPIKNKNMNDAQQWQLRIRTDFQKYLSEGLYCAGFQTDPDGGHSRYLFFKDVRREEE